MLDIRISQKKLKWVKGVSNVDCPNCGKDELRIKARINIHFQSVVALHMWCDACHYILSAEEVEECSTTDILNIDYHKMESNTGEDILDYSD